MTLIDGFWNEYRLTILRSLWGQGLTGAQIAQQLGGGITRNAVIGKAHRIGLPGRPSPIRRGGVDGSKTSTSKKLRTGRRAMRTIVKEGRERTAVIVKERTAPAPRKGYTPTPRAPSLHRCAWPIGDPRDRDFHFCQAQPVELGKPYCHEHCNQAYQRNQHADDTLPAGDCQEDRGENRR